MPFTDKELWTEISTDPENIGYGSDDDAVVAGLINAVSFVLPLAGVITRQLFVDRFAEPIFAIVGLTDPATKAKWEWAVTLLQVTPTVNMSSDFMQGMMQMMVADELTTPERLAQLSNIPASRAEVLWGSGAVISFIDIGRVRLNNSEA